MKKAVVRKSSERGGAGVKLLLIVLALFLIANACYHWVPVAYAGENFKQDIQTAVLQGFTSTGKIAPNEFVKKKILASAASNAIPEDVYIDVRTANGSIEAHIIYSQEVPLLPFGIYNYDYDFDFTATPTGYLTE